MKTTELQIKENNKGELYFNIPDDVLERIGWEEGDEVKFVEQGDSFLLKKVKYESVELDLDEEDLLKYMTYAHEQNITFNQFCEQAIEAKLEQDDRK
jgi:bifunctional DNA-binding transcriptional regulator/antitoxin component of YhaV-PrlF toxin-antitoxin module